MHGDADRLRHPSRGGRNPHHAAALSRRPLEGTGGEPGDRRPRSQLLPAQHAVFGPRRLAAGGRQQARQRSQNGAARRIRPARRQPRDLQRAVRRAGGVRSLHGCRLLQGDQRLDRGRMAGPRFAPARLDRGAAAGARSRDRGNRAPRRRPPFCLGSGAGAGRGPAREAAFLAGVAGRGKTQTADRDPRRQRIPAGAELGRLAVLPLRILHGRGAGVPGPDSQPGL